MRLVFAGTPEFARIALEALYNAGHQLELVLTQPERQAGRGLHVQPGPIKRSARQHALPLLEPSTLRLSADACDGAHAAKELLESLRPDAIVVAAYGLILPQWMLDLPRFGCLNIHASLLPRWRGAAPIQRAIEAGDTDTGITIMQMDAGLDTGPILFSRAISIGSDETAGTLHDRLAALGAESIVDAVTGLERGELTAYPQNHDQSTYASKIRKHEAFLDFSLPAHVLANKVRAFDPSPGCRAALRGTELKLFGAKACDDAHDKNFAAGEIIRIDSDGIVVAAGEGSLKLHELQKPGGRRMASGHFVAGFPLAIGDRFEAARE